MIKKADQHKLSQYEQNIVESWMQDHATELIADSQSRIASLLCNPEQPIELHTGIPSRHGHLGPAFLRMSAESPALLSKLVNDYLFLHNLSKISNNAPTIQAQIRSHPEMDDFDQVTIVIGAS